MKTQNKLQCQKYCRILKVLMDRIQMTNLWKL